MTTATKKIKSNDPTAHSATGDAEAVCINGLTHFYPQRKKTRRDKKQNQASHNTIATTSSSAAPQKPALDDVSFSIKKGEIFAILGPNGGGKTTLFRILSTMLRPSTNAHLEDNKSSQKPDNKKMRASIFGLDCASDSDLVRRQFGIVFQSPSLDSKLTACENLTHQGHLYGLRGEKLKQKIDYWLDNFGLLERKHSFIEHFSGGMRRRVEIAKALLHEPKLLLMDEPATGLDPAARREMWQLLKELQEKRGITIVFTTHLMEEAESCDRLAILAQGKLIALDNPANLKAKIGGDVVVITPSEDKKDNTPAQLAKLIQDNFAPWQPNSEPQVSGNTIRFEKNNATQIVAQISEKWPGSIKTVTVGQPTLEDVFLRLTGDTLHKTVSS